MTKGLMIALAVLSLALAGTGLALKTQLEVNGEQRVVLEQQATALKDAEKQRQEAEQAIQQRDETLTQIKQDNRRLKNEITKTLAGDSCADRPIPSALDQLLRERTKANKGLPTPNTTSRAGNPAMGWENLGRIGALDGRPDGRH